MSGFSLSLRHEQRLELRQEMRLSQQQRMALNVAMLQTRRDLVEAIHGETYNPRGVCPNPSCHYRMTDYEIMKGFSENSKDYTTECPKCYRRFYPKLYHARNGATVELQFFCPAQTLDQLRGLENTPLDALSREHQAVYRSAITHFGGLKQAFERIDIQYAFEADLDWRPKIDHFLGKLPDTVIAELVGAKAQEIRKLRAERGIPRYSRSDHAESLEE